MLDANCCWCVLYLTPRKVFSVRDPSSLSQGPICKAFSEYDQLFGTCPQHTAGAVDLSFH